MDIGDWLDRASIVYRSSAAGKRQALSVVADAAAKATNAKGDSEILDALMEREAQGSTGVGRGVAVPHARLAGLDHMKAVVVRLEKPVAFDAVDDQPVDILFALFAPGDCAERAPARPGAGVAASASGRGSRASAAGPFSRRHLRRAQPGSGSERRLRRVLTSSRI